MDRKDIFFSASVANLPEYKTAKSEHGASDRKTMLSYHLSMIHDLKATPSSAHTMNTPKRFIEETRFGISHMIHNALEKLFDVTLLKSFVFLMLASAHLCYAFAWMTPYIYLPSE